MSDHPKRPYVTRQCPADDCRLRYPAPADSEVGADCVMCGTPTEIVAHPQPSLHPPRPVTGPPDRELVLLLDNIRSVYNAGSLFRTADGAGVAHVHLGGITPTPDNPKMAKTALGAARNVAWTHHKNGVTAVEQLRTAGYDVWALEDTDRSESLFTLGRDAIPAKLLLVVGSEVAGVDPGILAMCARTVYLPMSGVKESLNVGVAGGTAVYHLRFG